MDKQTKKERAKLKKDLEFYLDYYKELSARSERMKEVLDREIEILIETLKQL